MIVYWDVIFLVNFIYQYVIYAVMNRLLYAGISKMRLVIGAIINCIILIITVPLVKADLLKDAEILKVSICIIMDFMITAIIFKEKRICRLGKLFLLQIVLSVFLAGVLLGLNTVGLNGYLLLTTMGAVSFMVISIKEVRSFVGRTSGEKGARYSVVLQCQNRVCRVTGLVDTGNGLADPVSGKPVCVIDFAVYTALCGNEKIDGQKGYRLIPYSSIGKSKGLLEAFIIDEIEITAETMMHFKNVLCAVSQKTLFHNKEYGMIIHPRIFMQ